MRRLLTQNYSGRPLFEGFVIVASILMAFAIEAWWGEQLDRSAENEALTRLYTEFMASRDMIGRNVGWQQGTGEAADELHRIILKQEGADTTVFPNHLLLTALFASTFDVATPVLDALVLSGQLSVVENGAVLSAIAIWQRSLKQVTEAEVGAQEFTETMLFPALIERGNLGLLMRNDNAQTGRQGGGSTQGERVGDGPPSVRAIRAAIRDEGETVLRVDGVLEGLIAKRTRDASRSAQALIRLEAAADRLIKAIETAQGQPTEDG